MNYIKLIGLLKTKSCTANVIDPEPKREPYGE